MDETSRESTPTQPPLTDLLRLLKAPALGYCVAFLTAFALLILTTFAIAISGGDSPREQVSEGAGSDDEGGLMVLIGLPFQLVGMGLLGRLHGSGDNVELSIFAPPLLVTLAYLATVYLAARAHERARPAKDWSTWLLTALMSAIAASLVVALITWIFALRFEGAAIHSASTGLVMGVGLLTLAASGAGRWSTLGWAFPHPVGFAIVQATGVWLRQLCVFATVLAPVLVLGSWAEANFGTALSFPLWAPTATLLAYPLAHFGGITTTFGGFAEGAEAETVFAWSDGPTGVVILTLIAVASALLASAWWSQRRPDTSLAEPLSWVPLPAAFALGGIVATGLATLSIGGAFSGFGADLTLRPALWTFLVLALWGLAIEALSRYVGPAIAAALPARLSLRRAQDSHSQPSGDSAPAWQAAGESGATVAQPAKVGPTLDPRQVRKVALISAGAVAALAVAWGAIAFTNSEVFDAEAAAEAYLDAVIEGDAETASSLAPVTQASEEFFLDQEASEDLLTNEVYAEAKNRPTSYEIVRASTEDDEATITVKLKTSDASQTIDLVLANAGSQKVLFDKWEVQGAGLARATWVYADDSLGSVKVNETQVDLANSDEFGGAGFWLLPGTYAFAAATENPWLEPATTDVTVNASEDGTSVEFPAAQPSQALKDAIEADLRQVLDACAEAAVIDPEGCPSSYAYYDVRKISWEVVARPTISMEYFDGSFPASIETDGAEMSVSYETDQSFLGAPDWQTETESITPYISGEVDLDGDELLIAWDIN